MIHSPIGQRGNIRKTLLVSSIVAVFITPFTAQSAKPILAKIAFTSPVERAVISPSNVTSFLVKGTCSEDGATVSITGEAEASPICKSSTFTAELDFSTAPEGEVMVTATFITSSGNRATVSRTFEKVTVAPIPSPSASPAALSPLAARR